jgi:hypothetical protein
MTKNNEVNLHDFFHSSDEDIPARHLFIQQYNAIPNVLYLDKHYHLGTSLEILRKVFKTINTEHNVQYYNVAADKLLYSSLLIKTDVGVYIWFRYMCTDEMIPVNQAIKPDFADKYIYSSLTIFYLPDAFKKVESLHKKLEPATLKHKIASSLSIVCKGNGYFYLNDFNIQFPDIDIELHYGKDFLPVHNKIITRLSNYDDKGIVLLHGIPGSGKTYYIRYLIAMITSKMVDNKRMIYIPPDMTKEISSPEFIPFLADYPNSVLIIEDSENIIQDRSQSQNQAVANLLNLSDGLLGDCLNLQIVATFNSDLTKIDKALLRKGRLIAEWKFDKLSLENSRKLAKHLGIKDKIEEPKTLAELYNYYDNVGV